MRKERQTEIIKINIYRKCIDQTRKLAEHKHTHTDHMQLTQIGSNNNYFGMFENNANIKS